MNASRNLSKSTPKKRTISEDFVPSSKQNRYAEIYREVCIKLSSAINTSILHGLKNNNLNLNIDTIFKSDFEPLAVMIEQCKFQIISLQGDENIANEASFSESKKPSKARRMSGSSISSSLIFSKTEIFQNTPTKSGLKIKERSYFSKSREIAFFARCLARNLNEFSSVLRVSLSFMQFTRESLEILSRGIKGNTSIKELLITNCHLTCPQLEALYGAISENPSIITLDLSYNDLSNNSGMHIGRIISAHAKRREDFIWLNSLRGESPEEDPLLKGICEINLSYNKFNDNCVKDLCSFLQFDTWIRSLNLRANEITEVGIEEILNALENNDSLLSIELRDNKGFVKDYPRKILEKLIANINIMKKINLCSDEYGEGLLQEVEGLSPDGESKHVSHDNLERKLFEKELIEAAEGVDEGHYGASNQFSAQSMDIDKFAEPKVNQKKKEASTTSIFLGKKPVVHDNPIKGKPLVSKKCPNCIDLERKLLLSEYKNFNLLFENKKLKAAFQCHNVTNNPNIFNSCSAIAPNLNDAQGASMQHQDGLSFNVVNNISYKSVPNENDLMESNQHEQQEEMFNKIEYMMVELTRMMDNLENMNNNVTNNFTYHMTNSTNMTNNNTYQLLNMNNANPLNFNSGFNNQSNYSNINQTVNNNLSRMNNPSMMIHAGHSSNSGFHNSALQNSANFNILGPSLSSGKKDYSKKGKNSSKKNSRMPDSVNKSDNITFSPKEKEISEHFQAVSGFIIPHND